MPISTIGLPVIARIDKRRAAARVAVDPGQHDAGDAGALAKGLGDIDRVLTGHRIGDEQGLVRRRDLAHRRDFEHQLLVDVEPPGGVEDDDVVALGAPGLQRPPGDRDRPLARHDRQRSDADLAAEHAPVAPAPPAAARRARRAAPSCGSALLSRLAIFAAVVVLPEPCSPTSMTATGGGAFRSMPLVLAPRLAAAEHLDEMVVDDLDDHLRRRHRAQHLLTERLLADRGDKVPDHRQRHIGLEQRDADLAHRGPDIVLGQRAVAAQPVEDVAEAIAQAVEHPASSNTRYATAKAPVRETRGLAARAVAPGVSLASSEARPERSRDAAFCQLRHPSPPPTLRSTFGGIETCEICSPLLAGNRPNLGGVAASPPLTRIEGAAAAVAFLSR